MKQFTRLVAAAFVCAIPGLPHNAVAQPAPAIPPITHVICSPAPYGNIKPVSLKDWLGRSTNG